MLKKRGGGGGENRAKKVVFVTFLTVFFFQSITTLDFKEINDQTLTPLNRFAICQASFCPDQKYPET